LSLTRHHAKEPKDLSVYSNRNPQTSTIEKHFVAKHANDWGKACEKAGLSSKPRVAKRDYGHVQNEEFTLDGMMHYILRWIAADDQVSLCHQLSSHAILIIMHHQPLHVVDSPEFREFLLYCARQLGDDDIPHHTKTTKAMVALFYELMNDWANEMRVRVFPLMWNYCLHGS
jgi:hypothetical protein